MGAHRRTNFTANLTRQTFGQKEQRTANPVDGLTACKR